MRVREILKMLKTDGWYIIDQVGSHIQLKHPDKKGKVTVPNHPGDVDKRVVKNLKKQAGL